MPLFNSWHNLANIAALRAFSTSTAGMADVVNVVGYYSSSITAEPDGGGGIFVYNSSDTTSSDNSGTIIVDALGRRWYRQASGAVRPEWFGAVGDGVTDDTAALQATLDSDAVSFAFNAGDTYLISDSLLPASGSVLVGNGATIKCPSAGWDTSGDGTHYGFFTLKNVSDIRISGFHFYGTKSAADITHTPKFIACFTANRIWIEGNYFENKDFEGIWPNSSSANGYFHICNNTFYDVAVASGLPAIQAQFHDSVVSGNILNTVGIAIGVNGDNNVISNNSINTFVGYGIAVTADGTLNRNGIISNNKIEFSPSGATNIGIYVGPTDSGHDPDPLFVTGNLVKITTSDTSNFSTGIRVDGPYANSVTVTNNAVEVVGVGKAIGFFAIGSAANTNTFRFVSNVIIFSGNTGSDVQEGFLVIPNGGTINTFVSGNAVLGLEVSAGNLAYDFTNAGGGTTGSFAFNGNLKTAGIIRGPDAGTIAADGSYNNRAYSLWEISCTVSALPSASTVGAGARGFVGDSNVTLAAGLGNTVVGGGTNKTPVYSDGTNWIIG